MKQRIIHTNSFVEDAAEIILDSAREAIEKRGSFRLALSGGNTPKPIYEMLAQEGSRIPWGKVRITFGDERCVGPEDDASNYRMARESLLDQVRIPPENVLRMRGELPPEEAAADYEAQLAAIAAESGEDRYVHDLILLGMGDDGHTASLFPGSEGLKETERNVIANYVEKFSTHRITFTFPLLNAARHVSFLVGSNDKEAIVQRILNGDSSFPSAHVRPENGELTWLLGF